ncbi:hypothetical protein SAMN02982927_02322 [Sporolactobacillus nakayamae]|uniref:Uncharacterized protein n=1 Tax=Sporolactobacillus nakayamae TaxID=269670 RepID=A0A1I2TIT8_9BACL|nr:hypothetical protein SAMN02982927_02322 [Sporolactobacillus nakayamae]
MHENSDPMHEKSGSMHENSDPMHEKSGSMHEKRWPMHENRGSMHETEIEIKPCTNDDAGMIMCFINAASSEKSAVTLIDTEAA